MFIFKWNGGKLAVVGVNGGELAAVGGDGGGGVYGVNGPKPTMGRDE